MNAVLRCFTLARMPISDYLRHLRRHVGHSPILMPAVLGVVLDERGQLLLTRPRDDPKNWYLVGGALDPHEQPADAIEREVREETGVRCRAERILAVYAESPVTYPNGDVTLYVTTAFLCRAIDGVSSAPHPADDELIEARFMPPDPLPPLRDSHRRSIELALRGAMAADFLRA